MLAPLHLVALLVGVGEARRPPVVDGVEGRRAEHLHRHAAGEVDAVELGLGAGGELHVGRGVEPRRAEEHAPCRRA